MPPPENPIRDVRETLPVAGVGGHIEFEWGTAAAPPKPGHGEKLEIQQWEIEHVYHNYEIAGSGGKGSIQRARVCDDFSFILALDLDLTPARQPAGGNVAPGPNSQPFPDGRLEGYPAGQFRIGVQFQCGDPAFWLNPNFQATAPTTIIEQPDGDGPFWFCPEVVLDQVRAVNSARGDGVVTCIVRGHGSAPLERWIGKVWCGSGAFGLDK